MPIARKSYETAELSMVPAESRSTVINLQRHPVAKHAVYVYQADMTQFTLDSLEDIVRARASAAPEESYTAKLLKDGITRAAKKLGEEAVELVIASISDDRTEIIKESADVLYHMLVVLHGSKVSLSEVMTELAQRTAQTGLAEKASRKM
jgi:phosphoribosyl-ATP pyrophosphohydrolase